jgi:phage gp37-like protein
LQGRIDYFQNSLQEWQQDSQSELAKAKEQAKLDQSDLQQEVADLKEEMEQLTAADLLQQTDQSESEFEKSALRKQVAELTAALEEERLLSAELKQECDDLSTAYSKMGEQVELKVAAETKKRLAEKDMKVAFLLDSMERDTEGRVQSTLDQAIQDVMNAKREAAVEVMSAEKELRAEKGTVHKLEETVRRLEEQTRELEEERTSLRKLAGTSWQVVKQRVKKRVPGLRSSEKKKKSEDDSFSI